MSDQPLRYDPARYVLRYTIEDYDQSGFAYTRVVGNRDDASQVSLYRRRPVTTRTGSGIITTAFEDEWVADFSLDAEDIAGDLLLTLSRNR